jgi:hypothetical protein
MPELNEIILPDDYPVYWNYLYVADGEVVKSDIMGTVSDLKRNLTGLGISCDEIKSCDVAGRQKLGGGNENQQNEKA